MPRHQIKLSLDSDLHKILMELSDESGIAASAFVVQWLELSKDQIINFTNQFKKPENTPVSTFELLQQIISPE